MCVCVPHTTEIVNFLLQNADLLKSVVDFLLEQDTFRKQTQEIVGYFECEAENLRNIWKFRMLFFLFFFCFFLPFFITFHFSFFFSFFFIFSFFRFFTFLFFLFFFLFSLLFIFHSSFHFSSFSHFSVFSLFFFSYVVRADAKTRKKIVQKFLL